MDQIREKLAAVRLENSNNEQNQAAKIELAKTLRVLGRTAENRKAIPTKELEESFLFLLSMVQPNIPPQTKVLALSALANLVVDRHAEFLNYKGTSALGSNLLKLHSTPENEMVQRVSMIVLGNLAAQGDSCRRAILSDDDCMGLILEVLNIPALETPALSVLTQIYDSEDFATFEQALKGRLPERLANVLPGTAPILKAGLDRAEEVLFRDASATTWEGKSRVWEKSLEAFAEQGVLELLVQDASKDSLSVLCSFATGWKMQHDLELRKAEAVKMAAQRLEAQGLQAQVQSQVTKRSKESSFIDIPSDKMYLSAKRRHLLLDHGVLEAVLRSLETSPDVEALQLLPLMSQNCDASVAARLPFTQLCQTALEISRELVEEKDKDDTGKKVLRLGQIRLACLETLANLLAFSENPAQTSFTLPPNAKELAAQLGLFVCETMARFDLEGTRAAINVLRLLCMAPSSCTRLVKGKFQDWSSLGPVLSIRDPATAGMAANVLKNIAAALVDNPDTMQKVFSPTLLQTGLDLDLEHCHPSVRVELARALALVFRSCPTTFSRASNLQILGLVAFLLASNHSILHTEALDAFLVADDSILDKCVEMMHSIVPNMSLESRVAYLAASAPDAQVKQKASTLQSRF